MPSSKYWCGEGKLQSIEGPVVAWPCEVMWLCGMQIDGDMMKELQDVKAAVQPTDVLLAVDAMTGQEAAGVVKAFNESAELTGKSMTHSRFHHQIEP